MRNAVAATLCLLVLGTMSIPAQSNVAQLADSGWQAITGGDADAAAAAFGRALSIRPADPVLNLGAGVAAHLQGREQDASAFLQKSIQLDPTLTQASALLGEILYSEGNLDLAIRTYEAALGHAPRDAMLKKRLESWKNEASSYQSYRTFKDDRFAVMFDGPVERELATHAAAVLRREFWRIGKEIGAYPSNPINVIFYTDQQFRDITGAPEWAKGGFDGQIRLPVRGALQNLDRFDGILTHELTHAILRGVVARNLPVWLNEGLAMHFEGADPGRAERALSSARIYVPLASLQASFTQLSASEAAVAYTESLFATRALIDRIGTAGLSQLLQDLDRGEAVDGAVKRFGFTMDDFEAKLARRVGATRPAVP